MVIKNWKKIGGSFWKDNPFGRSQIDFRYSKSNKGYFVIINNRKGLPSQHNRMERFFKTKQQALKFAKSYMRKN